MPKVLAALSEMGTKGKKKRNRKKSQISISYHKSQYHTRGHKGGETAGMFYIRRDLRGITIK